MATPPSWIQNDYWAPDREEVLNDPTRWGAGPNGQPAQPNQPNQPNQPTQSVDYSGYTAPPAGQPTNTGIAGPRTPSDPGYGASPAPSGSYDRSAFRDAWMGSGSKTTADLSNFVNAHQGDFGAGVKIMPGGKGDRIMLPDGTMIDAVIGAGLGGTGAGWTGSPSQMGNPGGTPGNPGTPGSPISATPQDPMVASLLQTLNDRAKQSLNINAQTDPNIRQQADPFAANLERQRRQYLNQEAEAQGPNANLTNEARLTAEQTGQQAGQFESGLIGNEIQARRTEIQNALSQMGGMLTQQQQMNLQKELAQLDDATKRYQVDSNTNISNNQINNDWRKALLTNDQFNSRLGLDAENDYNNWKHIFTS